jgi:AmiR/NasT family two-component response regulator
MKRSLRIVVADDEREMREYLREVLTHLGHEVVGAATDGRELVALCESQRPELVISDVRMPDMDGIEAATRIGIQSPVPIILVSAFHDSATIRRAEADHILAYLVKPIKANNLEPAIGLVMRRFDQFQELRREAATLKQALEDRKIIERAKGRLMHHAQLDEGEAYRRLQHAARSMQKKLVDAAALYLSMDELLFQTTPKGEPADR